MSLSTAQLVHLILREDVGSGDVTSKAAIPAQFRGTGAIVVKEPCVVAGLRVAFEVFAQMDADLQWTQYFKDGDKVAASTVLAKVSGSVRSILGAERVALNILQHLCGVATSTRRYVDLVRGSGVKILNTRKTLPLLREWQRAAVVSGGGFNHRSGLDDRYLIKSNHVVPVSYTHLRAHETSAHLVCRLSRLDYAGQFHARVGERGLGLDCRSSAGY